MFTDTETSYSSDFLEQIPCVKPYTGTNYKINELSSSSGIERGSIIDFSPSVTSNDKISFVEENTPRTITRGQMHKIAMESLEIFEKQWDDYATEDSRLFPIYEEGDDE